MKSVEAVIRLFDPDYNMRNISLRRRYKENPLFKRGTLFRNAVEVLKRASGPLTSREIVVALLKSKSIDKPSSKQIWNLYGGIQASLRNNEGKSIMRGEGWPTRWSLTQLGKVC